MMFELTAIYFDTSKANVINKLAGAVRYVEYGWIDGTRLIEKVSYAHDYVIDHISGVRQYRDESHFLISACSPDICADVAEAMTIAPKASLPAIKKCVWFTRKLR